MQGIYWSNVLVLNQTNGVNNNSRGDRFYSNNSSADVIKKLVFYRFKSLILDIKIIFDSENSLSTNSVGFSYSRQTFFKY